MKTFALAAVAPTAAATELTAANMAFVRYIAEFNKFYNTTEEFKFRQQIFDEAHEQIEAHNAEGHTWTLGHNQFSDWHADEYKVLLGYKPELRTAQYQDIVPTPYTPTNALSALPSTRTSSQLPAPQPTPTPHCPVPGHRPNSQHPNQRRLRTAQYQDIVPTP